NPDRTLTKVDDHAALVFRHVAHDVIQTAVASKDIRDHALLMKADRHVDAIADITIDDDDMLHGIPWQPVGECLGRSSNRLDGEAVNALNQSLLTLTVGDEIRDRD